MRNSFLILSFLAFLLLTTTQCKKDTVDQLSLLPPATTTGANTFGCLVNGAAMLPKESKPSLSNPYYTPATQVIFDSEVRIQLAGNNTGLPAEYMCFYIYNIYNSGDTIYTWGNATYGAQYYPYYSQLWGIFLNPKTLKYDWYGTYDNSGYLNVTRFDVTAHILAGTFNGKLVTRDNQTDTISVTNGRFDLKW